MGAWLSRCDADASALGTPAPEKFEGSDEKPSPVQVVTQHKGARHAPAARPLPHGASSRRAPCAGPPAIWGLVEFQAFPRHAVKGARFLSV